MTTLGNHHHNFPHLAKQSGFCFRLHNGRVNWAEIENLSINDIVENKNFQLLEENLTNVINCNLEEYDLKVIDQNFVKLFKLAQLGVDYLSYCESYLDKCAVILQEQLNTFKEECESLKHEKEKRKEEESRRKSKNHSYQCEKCDKVFISDVYLKFHDKRRHNVPSTPRRFDESPRKYTDRWQQTEGEGKSTISTQTTLLNTGGSTIANDNADTVTIKAQDSVKMASLEQEIQNLKNRLKKAEDALAEKVENCTAGSFPSLITGPPCHNTMLLLLPSCQAQSGSSCDEVKPRLLVSASEILHQNSSQVQDTVETKAVENKPSSESPSGFSTKPGIIISEKENGSTKAGGKFNGEKDVESTAELKRQTKEGSDCEKENIDPNKGKALTKLNKPLPPPRKSKKAISTVPATEDNAAMELPAPPKRGTQPKADAEGFCSQSAIVTSTPVRRKNNSDAFKRPRESLSDLNQQQSISDESFIRRRNPLVEDSSTSFFKTIVKKNSPKFRTFGQNLKRSLTNLCDSVSSTGKDFMKKESVDEKAKTPAIGRMNNRLRQMGVDPEWSGIPAKTMKQKLKALKQRRKLLTKENPMYPIIRQNIEEAILQKLGKNLGRKGSNTSKISEKQTPVEDEEAIIESEGMKPQSCIMYDIESDSESKTSDSEINFDQDMGERDVPLETADAKKEFDLTVFQIGGGSSRQIRQKDFSTKLEELLPDSDTDGDFSQENNFKALNKLLSDKKNGEIAEHDEGQNKSGNGNILKSTRGFHSTLHLNGKKKVWFLGNSNDSEEGLSDNPNGEEDLWSLKSDWEKNVG